MLHLRQNLAGKIVILCLIQAAIQIAFELFVADFVAFLKFAIISSVLLHSIIREMNKQICSSFQSVR